MAYSIHVEVLRGKDVIVDKGVTCGETVSVEECVTGAIESALDNIEDYLSKLHPWPKKLLLKIRVETEG